MEISIEVRNLEGESVTLSVPPTVSIADLKKILKDSFPPAKDSPNYHLFFKGSKMSLHSRLDSHRISSGEFIVLLPFVKKNKQLASSQEATEETTDASISCQESSLSSAANTAWLDIMNELSGMPDIKEDSERPNTYSSSSYEKHESVNETVSEHTTTISLKRGTNDNLPLHNLLNTYLKDFNDVFDQQTLTEVSQLVDSENCLTNSTTGRCLLFESYVGIIEKDSCLCPSWLKKVLRCFSFLNIIYVFFHAKHKYLTWKVIEEVLLLRSPGLHDLWISDVKTLSILCPKVVTVIDKEKVKEIKPGSAIVIANSSVESDGSPVPAKRRKIARKHTSTLVNAIEKRKLVFRADIWRLIKSFMEKQRQDSSMSLVLELDDLLALIKDGILVPDCYEMKLAKPRYFASGCHGVDQLEPSEMVDHLRKCMGMNGQIVHMEDINAKDAVYVELPDGLSDISRKALKGIGISRLYSHQAEAIQASLSKRNIVVATSTSSGKSLCYNIPVLEALSADLLGCALYIFPTKALAQDQLRGLLTLLKGLDVELNINVYDGDTCQEDRMWIRDNARLLITNPDMLHSSILPYHAKFQRILSNLRIIVIDETHVYKGAFGCHTALVLRRLRRICSHVYGCDPSFIFSTATSANPLEHSMELANLQSLELIKKDGSPSGQKYFLLWNPPLRPSNLSSRNKEISLIKEISTRRSSPILETSNLFAEMVRHGLRCIAFCKTRKLTELVMCYTRENLQESAPSLVESVCVYRGGYTPEDRRRIERDFFGGKLLGVVATNALELGIDVGHIDATLHLGFPGSVSSLWQQAGRSGRRSKPSLAIYVAFEGPLDQYFMKFPHKLFKKPIEHCQVDGQNQKVLEQHIACAADELPLCSVYDEKYFGSGLSVAITALKKKGYLGSNDTNNPGAPSYKMWNYIGSQERPSTAVNLRAIENEKYKVIDHLSHEVLEEIEESKAFFQVYEGAVYMHQGLTYLVKTLNLSEKIAFCEKADLKYYTKTRDYTDIHLIGGEIAYPPVRETEFVDAGATAQVHPCKVTTKWFGFYRIWKSSNQIYDTVDLFLPDFSYESQAAWIRVPQSIKQAVETEGLIFRAGLHAASHALLNVVPLYVMCNSSDLSTECTNPHETRSFPERLLLYDKHPGGIGIITEVQMLFKELLIASLELVSSCCCSSITGCPNCVQALLCSEYNEVLDKKAALMILMGVLEAEVFFRSSKDP